MDRRGNDEDRRPSPSPRHKNAAKFRFHRGRVVERKGNVAGSEDENTSRKVTNGTKNHRSKASNSKVMLPPGE